MGLLALVPIIGSVVEKVLGIVDKSIPDKDLAAKMKQEIELLVTQLDYNSLDKEIQAKADVLIAEIKGQSALQRNWRPILMLTIVAIVANNYLLYPYLTLFGFKATTLILPTELWNLMTLGVGGYILGRSGEKIVSSWRGKGGRNGSVD